MLIVRAATTGILPRAGSGEMRMSMAMSRTAATDATLDTQAEAISPRTARCRIHDPVGVRGATTAGREISR